MRLAALTTFGGIILYSILFLANMWFNLFDNNTLIKISLTFAIVVALVSILSIMTDKSNKGPDLPKQH